MGPTNSGKTHAALERLAAAGKGAYLAPLRLLALENYEALRDRGLNAGMVTGEEVFGDKGATHVSRTIETADLQHIVDVAVIDEIQMISDPDRGWAWTNALFGVPAKTLILAGSDDALPYVRRAAEAANESLEVVAFERKTPLVLLDKPVPLEEVKAGDAVVAFSRQAVHEQREILVGLGHTVATIYGALSPRCAAPRPSASAPARPTCSSPPTPSAWASTWGPCSGSCSPPCASSTARGSPAHQPRDTPDRRARRPLRPP